MNISRVQQDLEPESNARIHQELTAEAEPERPEPDDTQILRVKELIYSRAFQEQDAAFRPTTQQATLLIERNNKILQQDEAQKECGRMHCTNRSKCFRNRYRNQKYTNSMYLLQPCPKQTTTNATTNDTQHERGHKPMVPMPTGSNKVVTGTTESPQETRRHSTTEPAISHQQPDDPAKPKRNKRQRRRRAPQFKVCTTAEPQEPADEENTTNELDQWIEGLI